jgi:hypothetical protein
MRAIAWMVGLCWLVPGVGPTARVVDDLELSRKEFATAVQKAQAQYDAAVKSAADVHRARVQAALDRATKAGDLDRALGLRSELQGLGGDVLPLFGASGEVVPGRWRITYFPNGVRRTYVVKSSGEVTCTEANLKGRLRRDGSSVFLDFEEGKLERLTFAGSRVFVEHFNPKESFPQICQVGVGESVAAQ